MSQDDLHTPASEDASSCPAPSLREFVAMLALSMSLVAFSIDIMLPALHQIGHDFDVVRANSQQLIISALFAGLAIGQLFAGPLADDQGRKPTIYIGLIIFILGSILAYFAPTFESLLLGRFIQGLGAGAPRILPVTILRDRYEGREMAQIMSYIMGVFVFVPAIAPILGQLLLSFISWRECFLFLSVIACGLYVWVAMRLTETLHPKYRRPLRLATLWGGLVTVCTNRTSAGYMIATGLIFGAFISYLNSAQQIFQDHFQLGTRFPLYFAGSALALGVSFFFNSKWVRQYGIRCVITRALVCLISVSCLYLMYIIPNSGVSTLPLFMLFIVLSSFFMGFLFSNFNALAMMPMGRMAGLASSVIGFTYLVIAAVIGGIVGQLYHDTFLPIAISFLGLSVSSLALVCWIEGHFPIKAH